jgi:hypothetical protein
MQCPECIKLNPHDGKADVWIDLHNKYYAHHNEEIAPTVANSSHTGKPSRYTQGTDNTPRYLTVRRLSSVAMKNNDET